MMQIVHSEFYDAKGAPKFFSKESLHNFQRNAACEYFFLMQLS
jgi:hypothetical protein